MNQWSFSQINAAVSIVLLASFDFLRNPMQRKLGDFKEQCLSSVCPLIVMPLCSSLIVRTTKGGEGGGGGGGCDFESARRTTQQRVRKAAGSLLKNAPTQKLGSRVSDSALLEIEDLSLFIF